MRRLSRTANRQSAASVPGRPPVRPKSDAIVNLRLSRALRDTIDEAAAALGKSRTEFVLDIVRERATEVLLDRRLFTLDAERYAAFVQALEAPPAPNEKLKGLLRSRAPWER